jgi:hypothetical protein
MITNSLLNLQAADRNSYKTSCFHHGVNENCTLPGSYTARSGTTRCIIAQKSTVLKIILPSIVASIPQIWNVFNFFVILILVVHILTG